MVDSLGRKVKHYLQMLMIVAAPSAFVAMIGTEALADEEVSEFGSLKFAPDLEQCRDALALGNILKVEGDTYYVYFDVALFIIQVDDNGMRCRAARHINK